MAVYTTIDDPSAHFQTKIYSGDGNDDRDIAYDGNSDMQPDWLWFKRRNDTPNHILFDSTRGVTKRNHSNNTNVEATEANFLQAFNSNGFQVGTDTDINGSGGTYVSWGWKANGGSRTTFAEDGNNPAGGRQVNATAGFSIIDYTGTGATGTIAHGLGAKPDFWVIKNRAASGWSWYLYHGSNTSAPETELLYMNNTDATLDTDAVWNDTAPTSSVFTVNTNGGVNANDNTYICYLFTSIQGYSKFGGYTGNGNADGTFVYTGFKPAYVMWKETSEGNRGWMIMDTKRDDNVMGKYLQANSSSAENDFPFVDFTSNGFKHRHTSAWSNADGVTYIYMAFAENPFVTSGGVPCTAR